jgi:hypothetical protein
MAKFDLTRMFSRKDAGRRAGPARAGHDDHAARLWQVLLGPFSAKPAPLPQQRAPSRRQPAQRGSRGPGGA